MKESQMNGAECLLRTLLANDVNLCLMNPGTSEMQFVSALDRVPEMRGVLCLFEGVCSGAADGYARMTGKAAATLLHLGPGLANALANLHNARKARSPVVNIVGEHSTQHLVYDAPLTADIEGFARPVSGWVRTVEQAAAMGEAAASAVAAALGPPGKVATLIVPADFSWSEAGDPGCPGRKPPRPLPGFEQIREIARALRSGETAGILLSGSALHECGIRAADRIRAATGARIFANRNGARLARGGDIPAVERIPYFPEHAQALLAPMQRLILVEARPPVSFFGYPGLRGTLAPPDCAFDVLASEEQDGARALEWLAEALNAPLGATARAVRPDLPTGGELTAAAIGRIASALVPEGTIFSDESVSSNEALWLNLAGAARHEYLPVTGGAIGQGLPVALGAALACPQRKVVALEADGSGLYTTQSLWTMARERLDVTIVILANRRYRILDIEIARTGAGKMGPRAGEMIDLTRPEPDWIKLAQGFGVQAARAATVDEFIREFSAAMREPGPRLIEAQLS
ncbi:MAG: acetolactate synthase large subunit [Candidatus Sulfopaludibacter sp.]|nr:acetolactate synthase large subunit [Candidatus Sulfopaludibacter sp.]